MMWLDALVIAWLVVGTWFGVFLAIVANIVATDERFQDLETRRMLRLMEAVVPGCTPVVLALQAVSALIVGAATWPAILAAVGLESLRWPERKRIAAALEATVTRVKRRNHSGRRCIGGRRAQERIRRTLASLSDPTPS